MVARTDGSKANTNRKVGDAADRTPTENDGSRPSHPILALPSRSPLRPRGGCGNIARLLGLAIPLGLSTQAIGLVQAQQFTPVPHTAAGASGAATTVVTPADAQWETPQTRMRPIEYPSAVDSLRATSPPSLSASATAAAANGGNPSGIVETSTVRQTAWMQNAADGPGMTLPPGPNGGFAPPPTDGFAPPPTGGLPAPLSSNPSAGPINLPPPDTGTGPLPRPGVSSTPVVPMTPSFATQPGGVSPAVPQPQSPASLSDYAAIPQPQLNSGFATVGNCRNVTGPSGYRSDRILTCAPTSGYVTQVSDTAPSVYVPPPAQIGPPAILPPAAAFPTLPAQPLAAGPSVIPGTPKCRPLLSFGQDRNPVQVGQGILGQPTAYVPGQSIRNFIRYLTP